ncbi:MAG: type II and III secretion system protein family protein, partial [Alphaproteobacteria bacterium]
MTHPDRFSETFARRVRRHALLSALFVLLTVLAAGRAGAAPAVRTGPAPSATQLGTGQETLTLERGKGVLLRLKRPASDIFVADPRIADVQVKSPRLIYVLGKAAGVTSLYALAADDRPVYAAELVVATDPAPLEALLKEALPNAMIDVRLAPGVAILEGIAASPEDAEAAERYARQYLKMEVANRIRVTQPTQINLRVKFAEVGRQTLKQLGVNWQSLFDLGSNTMIGLATGRNILAGRPELGNVGGPLAGLLRDPNATDSLSISRLGNNVDLNAVIDALENHGLVTVLAEPNLTAVSGETAKFLAGGEFPVPVPQSLGQLAIEFRQFGVQLAFTPIVRADNKITLRVAPEVSQLSNNGAVTISGISVPALSTRRVETTVELSSGQSFAIAGLLQNTVTQDLRKFPGLGDLPVLGALFRSDRFRQQESELVVVVTPYVVRPTDT